MERKSSPPASNIPDPEGASSRRREAWVAPRITVLPRLSELTLQSGGIPGGGGTGGSGSTVVP